MAENSRMSKLSEKEDECIFSWKLFTGWDFMIGNTETAHNRIASVILGFKEALLEEAEKKKDLRNWRIISLRAVVNICVIILLAVSAYAVVFVVTRSDDHLKVQSWWRENETTIVVTMISITFPVFFELLGFLEHYHPRKQLRLQLARIMLLNLLNLYSLIFALFSKIDGMSKQLDTLKPTLDLNATTISNTTLNINESMALKIPSSCLQIQVPCGPCNIQITTPVRLADGIVIQTIGTTPFSIHNAYTTTTKPVISQTLSRRERDDGYTIQNKEETNSLLTNIKLGLDEMAKLKEFMRLRPTNFTTLIINDTSDSYDYEYTFDENNAESTTDVIDNGSDYSIYDYMTTVLDKSTDYPTTEYNTGKETDTMTTEYFETTYSSDDYPDTTTDMYHITETVYDTSYSPYDITNTNMDFSTEALTEPSTIDSSTTDIMTDTTTNFDVDDSTIQYTYTTDIIETSTSYTTNKISSESTTRSAYSDTPTKSTSKPIILKTLKPHMPVAKSSIMCPNVVFNCTVNCSGELITQVFFISNCTIVDKVCYKYTCLTNTSKERNDNTTLEDIAYVDEHKRTMYNLTKHTKKKLLKLCWETMFGQELIKLTMMDLVFVLLGTLFMDFFRALLVRYLNRCWCWDLEKKFPEYGDFKIAENILHLINNQGMVWMGMFFSPGLVVLNVVKLMIMMYLRSWAVMTCNVPHEVVFRVSKSNNFYLALLLTMLFLCVLPVGYTIVWVKPSWHCGPFSEYDKIYYILTTNIYKILPDRLTFALAYIASPAIVIPLLVLLILIIYYLTSLTNSLREANNDLKIQLRRERTEERRKMFQLADTRRRAGSSAMENTPFARWKKALPSLPMSKSIDSDDRKTLPEETKEPVKSTKKRGGIFAKIVGMALDKKTDVESVPEVEIPCPSPINVDDETDTDFHETLPAEVLKIKDITIIKPEAKKRNSVEFKTDDGKRHKSEDKDLKVKHDLYEDRTEKKAVIEKQKQDSKDGGKPKNASELPKEKRGYRKSNEKQTSETSTQSKQDSVGSVIPVITISTTESDEEGLSKTEKKSKSGDKDKTKQKHDGKPRKAPDLKSLRRQSSVESITEQSSHPQENKDEGHMYQYSL